MLEFSSIPQTTISRQAAVSVVRMFCHGKQILFFPSRVLQSFHIGLGLYFARVGGVPTTHQHANHSTLCSFAPEKLRTLNIVRMPASLQKTWYDHTSKNELL